MEIYENLKVGLETLIGKSKNLEAKNLGELLLLFGRLEVLVNKCTGGYEVNQIMYSAQDLQIKIHEELSSRIYK